MECRYGKWNANFPHTRSHSVHLFPGTHITSAKSCAHTHTLSLSLCQMQENSRVPFNGTIEASTLVGQKVTVKYLGGQCEHTHCNKTTCFVYQLVYLACCLAVISCVVVSCVVVSCVVVSCVVVSCVVVFRQTCRQTVTWMTCST